MRRVQQPAVSPGGWWLQRGWGGCERLGRHGGHGRACHAAAAAAMPVQVVPSPGGEHDAQIRPYMAMCGMARCCNRVLRLAPRAMCAVPWPQLCTPAIDTCIHCQGRCSCMAWPQSSSMLVKRLCCHAKHVHAGWSRSLLPAWLAPPMQAEEQRARHDAQDSAGEGGGFAVSGMAVDGHGGHTCRCGTR